MPRLKFGSLPFKKKQSDACFLGHPVLWSSGENVVFKLTDCQGDQVSTELSATCDNNDINFCECQYQIYNNPEKLWDRRETVACG